MSSFTTVQHSQDVSTVGVGVGVLGMVDVAVKVGVSVRVGVGVKVGVGVGVEPKVLQFTLVRIGPPPFDVSITNLSVPSPELITK